MLVVRNKYSFSFNPETNYVIFGFLCFYLLIMSVVAYNDALVAA